MEQEIRFCTTPDGVRVAYSTSGDGPALVKAANWLNHLEFDFTSPVWRHLLEELTSGHRLVRYDERGNGLSDWEVDDISFGAFVRDLETVVDAAGLERFPLLGISQGCAVSIAYAVRHPERVTRLILVGGYARGWGVRGTPEEIEQRRALQTLMRQGWGKENPAFRQLFTSLFVPGGTREQMEWFNELQQVSTSPDNAVRLDAALQDLDVLELLPRVTVPTLVMHSRGDARVPFEAGRGMASRIPGARFVTLESDNHLVLSHEPAWTRFVEELRKFLADPVGEAPSGGVRGASAQADSMNWDEIDRIFDEALDVSLVARRRWLQGRCADRPKLQSRVLRLLGLSQDPDDDLLQTGGALAGSIGDEVASLDTEEDSLKPGTRLGPYEIIEQIGRGGMGTVYRARHERLGREVAVKAVSGIVSAQAEALPRFQREARLLAGLDHPNVATVHDYMIVEGQPYLILELVDGESLGERLASGPLPLPELLPLARQLADALKEAHDKKIVHRDLKPANIKITSRGRIKVLDFGLAKTVVPAQGAKATLSFATGVQTLLGTPGYMSPEQAQGQEIDLRTDIWAFGCVLYEMLTGERAFRGDSVPDAIAAALRDEADWSRMPDGTPPALTDLTRRCLNKSPDDRPQRIDEICDALTRLVGQ